MVIFHHFWYDYLPEAKKKNENQASVDGEPVADTRWSSH
jgi:hypothetical protein